METSLAAILFLISKNSIFNKKIQSQYLTPVAGLIFEAKIERCFLESFFRERNFCPEQLSRAKNVARF